MKRHINPGAVSGADEIMSVGNKIIGVLQFVGSAISVIVLVVLGVKYMLGSVEEKAEYKKTMLPYFLGAIFVFGITNILGILNSIVGNI